MVRWTKLNADFQLAEEQVLQHLEEKKEQQRIKRERRLFKFIVVPMVSGFMLIILISATSVWAVGKIQEQKLAKQIEKEQKTPEKQELSTPDTEASTTLSEDEKSAKEILYKAFYDEQEKERLEEKALAKKKREERDEQEELSNTRAEIKEISENIKLALQKKEFADQEAFLATEEKIRAEERVFLATLERKRVEQQISILLHDKKRAEQNHIRANEEKNGIETRLQEAQEKKRRIDKDSLSKIEIKDNVDKEHLLSAIKDIESVEDEIKKINFNYEQADEALKLALEQKLKIEKKATDSKKATEKLKQEETDAIQEKETFVKELLLMNTAKKEMDTQLENLLKEKDKAALTLMNTLKQKGDFELVKSVAIKTRSFSNKVQNDLTKLRYIEGKNWLKRVKSELKKKNFFKARLMAARIVGFHGLGRNFQDGLPTRSSFTALLEPRSPEYQDVLHIFRNTPDIRLLWQTPIGSKRKGRIQVSFSPNGKSMAVGLGNEIKIWDVQRDAAPITILTHVGVTQVCFSPDGKTLASSGQDGIIKLWNASSYKMTDSLKGHTKGVTDLHFSPNGEILASASEDMNVRLWILSENNENIQPIAAHESAVTAICFSQDGRVLASAGSDSKIKLWDPLSGNLLFALTGHEGAISSLSFSPNNSMLASTGFDAKIRLWDRKRRQRITKLSGHHGTIYDLSFSPDNRMMLSSGEDGVRVWDIKTQKEIAAITGEVSPIYSVEFSPDGNSFLAAGTDNMKLWHVDSDPMVRVPTEMTPLKSEEEYSKRTLKGHSAPIINVCFSTDNIKMATASRDKTVKVWDMNSGRDIFTLKGHKGPVLSACFSMDGTALVSASLDSTLKVWNMDSGKEERTVRIHTGGIYSVSCSPDGATVASAGKDSEIKLWDLKTGKEKMVLKGHKGTVINLCFSPDGKALASSGKDSDVKLWDLRSGMEISTLKGHLDAAFSVAFSPDGMSLASASKDKTIKIWNSQTADEIFTLSGHTSTVYSVSFSGDGLTLASASKDGTVKLWDPISGKEKRTLISGDPTVYCIQYAFNGNSFAAGFADNSISLWQSESFQQLNYVDYLSIIDVDNFDLIWKPISKTSSYFNVSPNSHVGILRSGKPSHEIANNLFQLYLDRGNWNSALVLLDELRKSSKKEGKTKLVEKLKEASNDALDQDEVGLAKWRLQQVNGIEDTNQTNPDPGILYITARYQYAQAVKESPASLSSTEEVHSAFAGILDKLNQAFSLGLNKSARQLADDFDVELVEKIPEKNEELKQISARDWLEYAETIQESNQPKAIKYCLRALSKDEDMVKSYTPTKANPLMNYTLACTYSLRAQSHAENGETGAKADDIAQAIAWLKKAKMNGWSDWDQLKKDPKLKIIRSDPGFQTLINK